MDSTIITSTRHQRVKTAMETDMEQSGYKESYLTQRSGAFQRRNYQTLSFISTGQAVYDQFFVGMNSGCGGGNRSCHSHCMTSCCGGSQNTVGVPIFIQTEGEGNEEELELLRQKIRQLEARKPEVKVVKETDDTKVNQLISENQKLKLALQGEQERCRQKDKEIMDLRSQLQKQERQSNEKIKELEDKLAQYERKIAFLEEELEKLKLLLKQRDEEMEEWILKCQELENRGVTVIEEKTAYLSSEVDIWKRKFIELNREFHNTQEQYLLCQAELDSLRKGKQQQIITTTTTKTSSSSLRKSGMSGSEQK